MNLSDQQKAIISEALKIYWQFTKQRMSPERAVPIIQDIQDIIKQLNDGSDGAEQKPKGVTDTQFENVCKAGCEFYKGKCTSSVAIKFPGKCDPIIKYNQQQGDDNVGSRTDSSS